MIAVSFKDAATQIEIRLASLEHRMAGMAETMATFGAPCTPSDPMDEADKRDRVDYAGFIWSWNNIKGLWEHVGRSVPDAESLADIARDAGPLAFADDEDEDEGEGEFRCVRTLAGCLQDIERDRPGTDANPTTEQFQEGLHAAYDWLRSVLVEHGFAVSPVADPLDEDDHRDRYGAYGLRLVRHGHRHWRPAGAGCEEEHQIPLVWSLNMWSAIVGPLTFADAVGGDGK